MAEFKAITTQEELNSVIGERIKEIREQAEKKYSDYETVKAQNKEYEQKLADVRGQLSEANEKLGTVDKLVAEKDSTIKAYETASVKTRIANEIGLPYDLATRLSGDDEESIRKDAEALFKAIGTRTQTAPLRNTEPAVVDDKKRAIKNLAQRIGE